MRTKNIAPILLIACSSLAAASAAQARVMDVILAPFEVTTFGPLISTFYTAFNLSNGHHRAENEALVEEAMEFRATGKMTIEFREKLEAIRATIKEQNLDATISDEELAQAIVEAGKAAKQATK